MCECSYTHAVALLALIALLARILDDELARLDILAEGLDLVLDACIEARSGAVKRRDAENAVGHAVAHRARLELAVLHLIAEIHEHVRQIVERSDDNRLGRDDILVENRTKRENLAVLRSF